MPGFGVDDCHTSCASQHRPIDELATARLAVVERSPDILGGTPVFRGTLVPARALLDYLATGDSLDTFLTISRPSAASRLRPAGKYRLEAASMTITAPVRVPDPQPASAAACSRSPTFSSLLGLRLA